MLSGVPKDNLKLANEIFEDFERKGFVAKHPTKHGLTYEITKKGAKEFKLILDEYIAEKKGEFGLARID